MMKPTTYCPAAASSTSQVNIRSPKVSVSPSWRTVSSHLPLTIQVHPFIQDGEGVARLGDDLARCAGSLFTGEAKHLLQFAIDKVQPGVAVRRPSRRRCKCLPPCRRPARWRRRTFRG